MARDFRDLVEDEIKTLGESMFTLTLGDSLGHARKVGMRQGLELAKELYAKANKTDLDEDAS